MAVGLLALVSAAVFFGAAAYVLFVEHVARDTLDDRSALAEWKPAYRRGAAMQASIAIITTLLGLWAWWQLEHPAFLVGAILAVLPWPWTLLVIKPTNDRLLALPVDQAGPDSRLLLKRWGRQHSVRTVLGGLATTAFVIALTAGTTIKTPMSVERFMGKPGDFYPEHK